MTFEDITVRCAIHAVQSRGNPFQDLCERIWLPTLDDFRNFLLNNEVAPIIQELALTKA